MEDIIAKYKGNYIKEMRKSVGHAPLMVTSCGVIIENEKGEIACRATIVQMFIDLATRNALWCSPPIWEDCKKKWIAGEFYRD